MVLFAGQKIAQDDKRSQAGRELSRIKQVGDPSKCVL
jgi:hypothetical protein